MIQENELLTFLLCLVTLAFIILNRKRVNVIPRFKIFIVSFAFFTSGWFFTVIEGINLGEFCNIIEHVSYLISAVSFIIWIILPVFNRGIDE